MPLLSSYILVYLINIKGRLIIYLNIKIKGL